MTLRLRILNAWLRNVEKPRLARMPGPPEMRLHFERTARLTFCTSPYVLYQPDKMGDVPVLWAGARARGPGLILYFHGGGYVFGSPETHRGMLAQLSRMTGARTCLPAYRLAPEHPFPTAFDDALAAWEALLARGYRAEHIVLGGDSAGGGLALALLGHLCRAGGALPAGAFAFSPWSDLALSGASLRDNAATEALLPVIRITELRDYYLAGADPTDPRASPLTARFPGCPPVFLQASRSEILRDDTTRMAAALAGQGARVELDLWEDCPHVWPIFHGRLPEADVALTRVAAFVRGLQASVASL